VPCALPWVTTTASSPSQRMVSRYISGVGSGSAGRPAPSSRMAKPGRYMCICVSTAPFGIGVRGFVPESFRSIMPPPVQSVPARRGRSRCRGRARRGCGPHPARARWGSSPPPAGTGCGCGRTP